MLEITRSAISQKLVNQKKYTQPSYICLHLSANLLVEIQNTHHYRNLLTFSISAELVLNGPANRAPVAYSKIQNRLTRAP